MDQKVLIDSLSHCITIDASTGNSKKTELEIAPLSEISDKFCDIFVHQIECWKIWKWYGGSFESSCNKEDTNIESVDSI